MTIQLATSPRGLAPLLDRVAWATTFVLIVSVPVEDSFMFGPLSPSRVAAIAALIPTGLNALVRRRLLIDRSLTVVLLAFLAWVDLGLFWSYDAGLTTIYLLTMTQLVLLVLIIWQNVTTPERWRAALVAASLGGLLGAVLSLLDTVSAHGGPPRYAIGDPNDFGIRMTVVLVATIYLAVSGTSWARMAFSVVALLDVVAISRTASRTAAIAVILALAILLFTRRTLRPSRLFAVLALCATAVVAVRSFTTNAALGRIQGSLTALDTGDLNNRTYVWRLALRYWSQHPLTGIGGGTFRERSLIDGGGDKVPHSVFIGLLVETGIVGLVLFLIAVGVTGVCVLRSRGLYPSRYVLAMAAVWLCGALTITLETRKITWLLIGLFTCLGAKDYFAPESPERPVTRAEAFAGGEV
jgi:O-antigen ligase